MIYTLKLKALSLQKHKSKMMCKDSHVILSTVYGQKIRFNFAVQCKGHAVMYKCIQKCMQKMAHLLSVHYTNHKNLAIYAPNSL